MPYRVLITGGAGFIGSSVALAMAERHPDWQVLVADNLYRRGSELNLPRLKAAGIAFHHVDVRHPADLAAVGRIDALVECSAEPSVLGADGVVVPVNLVGAYHCFEFAKESAAQVIFLSTSRVYPIAPQDELSYVETPSRFELSPAQRCLGSSGAGISESFPLDGRRTMYGASKLAAEMLLAEYDVPWIVNRCGVVAGPWQMGKVDQGVFTHWMLSFLDDRPLSYIGYGGTGKQVRDLLHVMDLVDLVERQLLDPEHWNRRTFNVGGGRPISLSLREATELCEQITGVTKDVGAVLENRTGDVRVYLTDGQALANHDAWRPRRDARTILQDIHDWIVSHEDVVRALA